MSVSSLPEWKQLLLEKKRREEEERERREKEEEEKLASMPAWKRGIIQRRKAKQECFGDREKDVCLLQVDVRSPSDGLSDTDSSVTVNLGSEPSLSPDTGLWLDADPKSVSEVSAETIVPVHENPFIRTQSVWKERGNEVDVKEREKDRLNPMGQDGESGRGRNIELKIERYRDLSEGRERDMSRDRSQGRERENNREATEKDKGPWKESAKERDFLKVRKDEEEKETEPTGSFSPLPCLRTIRADNIIIIEQERKGSDERRGRWREAERERPEEDQQGKRGMKMDLREILAGGGSVTEIRASEVLIIQPPASSEERNPGGGGGREEGEMKCTVDGRRESVGRELRTNISWQRDKDKETAKEKERPCGQATVIKDDRKDTSDDNGFVERGGRVSQLLSKFGEHPKPPSRSKSSDNFLRPGRRKYSGDHNDQQSEDRRAGERNMLMKGLPKRSFSFSDRVVSTRENGLDEDQYYERKMHERIHSDKRVAPWMDVAGLRKETTAKIKMGCARFLDKDRFGKRREGQLKNEDAEAEMCILHRNEAKKVELVDKRAAEKAGDADGDEGFTVASVKNTEGISFARRVPIRQDGKTKAADRDLDMGGQIELQSCDKKVSDFQREEGFDNTIASETLQNYVTGASAEPASSCHTAEGQYRHASAFTECSSLLCTVAAERGAEWRGTGPSGVHQGHSVLSQHTEDLITKIEKIGDTTVYINEKGERTYRAAYEITQESKHEGQVYSENLVHDITPRSPKKTASVGIPSCPLEIEIPRTVFYIGEEMSERKKAAGQSEEGQDVGGGQGVERRDSWRIGKPLSRIESLREKIRQRELERLKQRELQDGEGSEGAEAFDAEAAGDRYEDRGTEIEWEAAHKRKRLVETERGQEDAAAQKSPATAADVTQEVGVLKTCPQLPVSVAHSQVDTTEEVTSSAATAAAEVISDSFQTSEDEDDPQEHVEEQLRRHRSRLQSREEDSEDDAKELSEEEEKEYISSLDPAQSLPSPTHPNSLAAMSRIYNLETVGSRSGLCMRDKPVDIPSVHLVKVKPIISNAQQADSKGLSGEDICGVQSIQRQIEQFQLNVTSTSPNTSRNDRDVKGQQSPKRVLKHHLKDDIKIQEKDQQTSESNPKVSPQRVCSPAPQLKQSNQTITIGSSNLRSQSPDSFLKPSDGAPTPASSPCSPSPAQSPSISPSPTPSPTLFSIRSASGGQVKRGATITITPKKPAGGGGGGGGGGRVAGSTTGSTTSGSTTSKIPHQQTHTTSTVSEPARKRYPAVEDIVVIGGYLNLEKSCLVKSKGTPKRGKVYFDEDQLEQVCEYPSETSMLASTPYPHDQGRNDRLQGEEAQEEEGGAVLSKSTRNVGITTGRGLKVDESCPR